MKLKTHFFPISHIINNINALTHMHKFHTPGHLKITKQGKESNLSPYCLLRTWNSVLHFASRLQCAYGKQASLTGPCSLKKMKVQAAQRSCSAPSLEALKARLDEAPGSWAGGGGGSPAHGKGLSRLPSPFQPKPLCDFYEVKHHSLKSF